MSDKTEFVKYYETVKEAFEKISFFRGYLYPEIVCNSSNLCDTIKFDERKDGFCVCKKCISLYKQMEQCGYKNNHEITYEDSCIACRDMHIQMMFVGVWTKKKLLRLHYMQIYQNIYNTIINTKYTTITTRRKQGKHNFLYFDRKIAAALNSINEGKLAIDRVRQIFRYYCREIILDNL
jgi:hypothetical protein